MTQNEMLKEIEDLLDVPSGTLKIDMELNSIPEYDSMAKLTLIVYCDDEFSKKLTAEHLNEFKTVNDVISFFQS
jgi:acyl carrier protein